jgi:hypothetical protein
VPEQLVVDEFWNVDWHLSLDLNPRLAVKVADAQKASRYERDDFPL